MAGMLWLFYTTSHGVGSHFQQEGAPSVQVSVTLFYAFGAHRDKQERGLSRISSSQVCHSKSIHHAIDFIPFVSIPPTVAKFKNFTVASYPALQGQDKLHGLLLVNKNPRVLTRLQ